MKTNFKIAYLACYSLGLVHQEVCRLAVESRRLVAGHIFTVNRNLLHAAMFATSRVCFWLQGKESKRLLLLPSCWHMGQFGKVSSEAVMKH